MYKHLLTFIFSFACLFSINAQTWELLGESPYRSHHSLGFSLNGIGYSVAGSINEVPSSRVYSYDPATNIWTQEEDFPGPSRGFAISDTWDGKAYLGFGVDENNNLLNDLWVFDADANTWTELASCPCDARIHPAFVANQDKIFVGMGAGGAGNMNDWWEYDMASDSWSQKPDFPDLPRHHPYQFAVGDYVYAGLGHGNNVNNNFNIFDELYRYDPQTEVWDQMKTLPSEGRVAGTQFSYNGKGYVLSGDGDNHAVMPFGEFWEYDPVEDKWKGMPPHPGSSRWAPSSFLIDDYIYFYNGYSLSLVEDLNVYRFYLGEGNPQTSTEDLINEEVIISPNPATDKVTIQLTEADAEIKNISLFNLNGQLILEQNTSSNSITLNIENIPTAVYYLKIELKDQVISQKIIKQ